MSTLLLTHGGGAPEGIDVAAAGTRLLISDTDGLRKYVRITNASDTIIYLAFHENGGVNTAVVGRGIYLAANGGYIELNNDNMYTGEVWAIHNGAGVKRVCVQAGK